MMYTTMKSSADIGRGRQFPSAYFVFRCTWRIIFSRRRCFFSQSKVVSASNVAPGWIIVSRQTKKYFPSGISFGTVQWRLIQCTIICILEEQHLFYIFSVTQGMGGMWWRRISISWVGELVGSGKSTAMSFVDAGDIGVRLRCSGISIVIVLFGSSSLCMQFDREARGLNLRPISP